METTLNKDWTINAIVGDLIRLKIYAEKSLQIPMDVPDRVWNAYEKLVRLGYDKSIVK